MNFLDILARQPAIRDASFPMPRLHFALLCPSFNIRMLAELSLFLLLIAFGCSALQIASGLNGALAVARSASLLQAGFTGAAFLGLIGLFLADDFSVLYVVSNSNHDLPLLYKVSATWGAHEGSLLLWALILALWSAGLALWRKNLEDQVYRWTLVVMGAVAFGMFAFLIFTSNPFDRLVPPAAEGRSLNPLLQDPGLALHPPMLYIGYVGLAAPFALALGALLSGRLGPETIRAMRMFTLGAWIALTGGIVLGSWWAYNELGWGGWWFWDPVENASFMPWLVAAALVHSLSVAEKRHTLLGWSCLLAIFAFGLSLIGTFLVRSGIITSVHAFANDPERGLFILAFFVAIIGAGLLIYLVKVGALERHRVSEPAPLVSRESFLVLNNVVLVSMTATVLLGTLFPLIAEALNLGKVSVGPPYFERVFAPLGLILAALLAVTVHLGWRKRQAYARRYRRALVLGGAGVVGAYGLALSVLDPLAAGGITIAGLVALSTLWQVAQRIKAGVWKNPGFLGMCTAHMGLAVFMVGVVVVSTSSLSKDVHLRPGDAYRLGDYQFEFQGIRQQPIENYDSLQAHLTLTDMARNRTFPLVAEKRRYANATMPFTEAGIKTIALTTDIYVSLGEIQDDGGYTFRFQIKPFMTWVWAGGALIAFGAALAMVGLRRKPR